MKKLLLLTLGAAAAYQVAKRNNITLDDVKHSFEGLKKYVMPTE